MAIISARKGSKVRFGGQVMTVAGSRDLDTLILISAAGDYHYATFAELEAEHAGSAKPNVNVDLRREEKIPAYVAAFKPILEKDRCTKAEVEEAGAKLGISVSAAYEALKRYRLSGKASDLPPPTRPGGRGKSRLREDIEATIQKTIEDVLLTRRNHSRRGFYKEVNRRLRKIGGEVAKTTLTNRCNAIPEYKFEKARSGYTDARRKLAPLKGSTPEATKPLESVQIDHWKCDCEILSDDRLTVIGRVWITLAIDLYSRMIWGFHVGLDDPGIVPVALTMINGMTRKDRMIKKYGLEMSYPIAGRILKLKCDNAKEFRGNSLAASCDHFLIEIEWRPVRQPQYGAHIERLNGWLAQEFEDLPGATGRSPGDRKRLRPTATAAFTLEDLIKEVLLLIDKHHNKPHEGLGGMTPLEKYTSYFVTKDGAVNPLPDVYVDDLDLRMNWYPLEPRTLQRYGIRIDYLEYYSEALQYLVMNRRQYGKLMVRRNPFDVREIYVLHPERKEWIVVPTRHVGFPLASIKELQKALREAKARGRQPTPDNLARIIEEEHRHVETAVKLTRQAAREQARRNHHGRLREEAPSAARPAQAAPVLDTGQQPDLKLPSSTVSPRHAPIPAGESLGTLLARLSDEEIEASLDDL